MDDDRQWFKARVGFEPSETTLDQSVCSHAILHDDLFEIEDMASDPRTADNPLHTDGPKVSFYAGANLVAPNGMPIGTLCVLDNKPRKLTEFQRRALRTLSRQVMTQLELRKRLREEKSLRSEIDHRVKNSLQTIASILRMATRGVTDPNALDVLQLVERRLSAVASLHTELMDRDGASSVEMQTYLSRVIQLLNDAAPDTVIITHDSVEASMDARKASALGMIISEFVANSIKHAFPDGQNGTVHVTLFRNGRSDWRLTCTDDGVGRAGADHEGTSTGLGERIMSSAATQLSGQMDFETNTNGTTLTVNFPA